MRVYIGHIWGQQWGMRAYMGHIWGHTWATWEQQWGMHARIHGPYGSSNRACIRAYMAIYGSIHGPHGSSNGACMRAYMGHLWGSPIGRAGRKGIAGNPFPSLAVPAPSLPLPSLPYSVA
jgi:hypothetical protein